MGLKETFARLLHLDKKQPPTESDILLRNFLNNPEIVYYDSMNQPIPYTGDYTDLIRDIRKRKSYIQLSTKENQILVGVPFTEHRGIKSSLDKEFFQGGVKHYGVTYNEPYYIQDEVLGGSIHIDNFGMRVYLYEEYIQLVNSPDLIVIP